MSFTTINAPLRTAQIRHAHDLHHQTSPAGEMLRTLSPARLGIVLLPSKARLLPLLIHISNQVDTQLGIEVKGFVLVGAGSLCVFLHG